MDHNVVPMVHTSLDKNDNDNHNRMRPMGWGTDANQSRWPWETISDSQYHKEQYSWSARHETNYSI